MTRPENKFFDFIRRHIFVIAIIATVVLGLLIRTAGLDFRSGDYDTFLEYWWNKIGSYGIKNQVGNYNIPYQTLILIMSKLPFPPLVAYKMLSTVFDFVLAIAAALLTKELDPAHSRLKSVIAFSAVFCSITVILNSAFWAQCDSIYTSFIILAVYFMIKDRSVLAFIMLGFSFSFKLQVIFIIPVFLYYYITTRKISIFHFLIIPAVDVVLCIPALLRGRNPLSIIKVYIDQPGTDDNLNENSPNIFSLICDSQQLEYRNLFLLFGILITFMVLFAGLCIVIHKNTDLTDPQMFIMTSIWTMYTVLYFMPSMHERYTYPLDILMIVFFIVQGKRLWVPLVVYLTSFTIYNGYLFAYVTTRYCLVAYAIMYTYITYMYFRTVMNDGKIPENISQPFKVSKTKPEIPELNS